ncbi:threonine--tRNA ligase [Patescibacteria group bacterium]|nr:threonine--tRNA ligase [Patescibacteria group bacterium]
MSKKIENEEYLHAMRHSLAHIMAEAVQDMFPEVQFGIGPVIDNGFYYDFDLPRTLVPEDLPLIEKKMRHIIKQNNKFKRQEVSKKEAMDFFEKAKEPYKKELIDELEDGEITLYRSGKFVDLCKGPHVESTGKVGAFKLTHISGAYWRGDEKNKMLQRIYGVAFATQEEVDHYLAMLEEAKKRDHRRLGKELDLFMIDPMVGSGLPLWLPKGAMLYKTIEDFWYNTHLKNGYEIVRTPHIGSKKLWEKSGHWNFYNASMYPPMEVGKSLEEHQKGVESKVKEEYLIKPMNCPFQVVMYNSKMHSYRDLPKRWAEVGTVYRYEQSGELNGLLRVRCISIDDAHIIVTKDQALEELMKVVDFIKFFFKTFGFEDFVVYLSLRDPKNNEKYVGDNGGWEFTEGVLEEVAKKKKLKVIREEGEAAFYGPKLDFKVKDAIGREWQCSTLQFDFNLPERFDMTYINENGEEERPYMLHRALFGSFERFIGLLIEQYSGAFPLWLSPTQVRIIPVSTEKHMDYANQITEELKKKDFRVEVDSAEESVGKKIRNAELAKVNYMIIVGDRDIENNTVSVRPLAGEDMGAMTLKDFVKIIKKERDKKEIKE